MDKIRIMYEALNARYTKANGPLSGGGRKMPGETLASAGAGGGFRNMRELVHAQKDPRYKTDPVYQRDVLDRLKRSNF